MIDSHCHLNDIQFQGEEDKIITNFLNVGVNKVVTIGCNPQWNSEAIKLSNKYECVYCAVGVHPDDCDTFDEKEFEQMLAERSKKLVAVGEIGLDYFHNVENKDKQKQVFEAQIKLAKKYNLPIVIHCRDAYGDTLEILKKHAPYKNGVVMHCYSGSWEFAKELIKLGVKFSFTGTVTYKNARNVQEVAKNLPSDSIFFETDCPYLAPVPYRGKRNEPSYVKEVYEFVAQLRGITFKEMEEIADQNAKNFFNI